MTRAEPPTDETSLLEELRRAVAAAPERPREIEVGIALSIALGRQRPAVSCGGCQNPLEFDGIPARTNSQLRAPFRLLFGPETDA
ncbi:MAG TPA: hypothetical protein VEG42_01440 [Thermoplasmata archaeon]|nr:hypothetical protein [Thermoplasmata archaeon]